jgi:hypothetical protein
VTVGGVGFSPLRASGKRLYFSLFRSSPVNLGSRASYRHGGSDPLPMDLVVTPSFKALTDLWSEIQTQFDRSGLRSIQHSPPRSQLSS